MQFYNISLEDTSTTSGYFVDDFDAFTVVSFAWGNTDPNVSMSIDVTGILDTQPHTVLFTGDTAWTEFVNSSDEYFTYMKNWTRSFSTKFSGLVTDVGNISEDLYVYVYSLFDSAVELLHSDLNTINTNISSHLSSVREGIAAFQTEFTEQMTLSIDRLTSIYSNTFTIVTNYLPKIKDELVNFHSDVINKLDELFGEKEPTTPEGSEIVDDYINAEQEISNGVQGGSAAVDDTFQSAENGLSSYLAGFAVVSGIFGLALQIDFLQALVNISLAIGIFASLVNIVPGAIEKFSRGNSQSKGG